MARTHPSVDQYKEKADSMYHDGKRLLNDDPLFRALSTRLTFYRHQSNKCPKGGWAAVDNTGVIHVNPDVKLDPNTWKYVLAHCLLHLAFDHFGKKMKYREKEWNAACDIVIARFLDDLGVGTPVQRVCWHQYQLPRSEEKLYEEFCLSGIPEELSNLGTACSACDMIFIEPDAPVEISKKELKRRKTQLVKAVKEETWGEIFGRGLSYAVQEAVRSAANGPVPVGGQPKKQTIAEKARSWFISSYPLLGALAASFKIIEDQHICNRQDIRVAAVNMSLREIYINPLAMLGEAEMRFVMAHELLHVGLRHDIRTEWRDPYLWNVACDYVINGWLMEMGVGVPPQIGVLFDPSLRGMSAEEVYDTIRNDLRRMRKLVTLRGAGLGDILQGTGGQRLGDGTTLDEFCRRALIDGLEYHTRQGRGYLPAELVEEINVLGAPVIPWDVQLTLWFDEHFSPLEKRRTYARPSRRQSVTPDIATPRWYLPYDEDKSRTYAVVLDTSGSMDRSLLAVALGSIASYSESRDVLRTRVVFCDAMAYDQGYMAADDIAGRVRVKGRGGTVLQPGIDLLEAASDFPKTGPILIITDGYCEDSLKINRDHAFLIPDGASLPFRAQGPVFRIKL